jgi:hypothetical protein
MPDPIEVLRGLDADALQERLHQIDQERKALIILLRAARTRDYRPEPILAPRATREKKEASRAQ